MFELIFGIAASLIAAIIVAVWVWGWPLFRSWLERRSGRAPVGSDETQAPERPPDEEGAPAPPTTRAPADPRDLLKSYPEQQDKWVGREDELGELSEAWEGCEARVFTVVGFGGQGKSALARRFTESLRRDKDDERRPVVVWWSFYLNRSADEFFDAAARHLRIPTQDTETGRKLTSERLAPEFVAKLSGGVHGRRLLLVLDGLEVLQDRTTGREGRLTDAGVHALIRGALDEARPNPPHPGMILVTIRATLRDLRREDDPAFAARTLDELSVRDGAALLTEQYGLRIDADEAKAFAQEVRGHALTLTLAGTLLNEAGARGATLDELRRFIVSEEARVTDPDVTKHTHRLPGYVLRHCADGLTDEEAQFMRLLSCCVRPASRRDVEEVFLQPIGESDAARAINDKLVGKEYSTVLIGIIRHLRALRLVEGDEEAGYDTHPLIRRHFYEEETGAAALTREQREAVHSRFFKVLPDREKKHHPETLDEMQPLIDAVLHGCRAGLGQRALPELYYTRMGRRDRRRATFFLSADLGAVETELQLLRAFFPGGVFDAEPMVSNEEWRGYLVNAAALALMNTGRPSVAVPLFQRALQTPRRHSDWANASMGSRNLSEAFGYLGRLPEALAAAEDALTEVGKLPAEHEDKRPYTIFSHGYAARAAALCGDDEAASLHFTAALGLHSKDWLWGIDGASHCTWLARTGKLERARSDARQNADFCADRGDLPSQTFVGATQVLIERLAWAVGDPNRATLDEMRSFADRGVEVGRRSGNHHYLTYALLEAARCAIASAVHETDRREEFMKQAKRRLDEVDQRAAFAEYRLIEADAHVARAELAKLAGDEDTMRKECEAAIAICDDPTCGYAWAKQDAEKLLSG